MQEPPPPQSSRFVNYAMGAFLLFLAAVGIWTYFTKVYPNTPQGAQWLTVLLTLACLGGGLYLLTNPKGSIKSETYRKWYLVTEYSAGAARMLIGLVLLAALLFFEVRGERWNPLIYLVPLVIILSGIGQIYYAKSVLSGKRWVRTALIVSLLVLFLNLLVRLIIIVNAGANMLTIFWTTFVLIIAGAGTLFVLFNKRIKAFYTQ